ncbi:MAG: UDP-N-acetylglucosamine 2-epimerase (non-hydrolyzing) [Gammaproteobacteria bacterium]|nr:UDP-N-acetylglucosamine 2-epimerase (non-hydrolyzing) [Gammaproteobacteria bacterium]
MIKVMTIVGTRPELIKMACVINEFDKYTNHVLVHTGQNFDYELTQVFFDDMGIRKPDYFLDVAAGTIKVAQTIAQIIERSDEVMEKEQPDALLIYGDTNSCLAVICAKRRKIPVFHMEAGNRCFDQRVPEELNRTVVDHLSDINMVLTEHARRYLIAEGLPQERIIKVGSHMQEILAQHRDKITQSKILAELNLTTKGYFVVSSHREENVDVPRHLQNLLQTLQALVAAYDFPIIVSTHPRTRLQLEKQGLTIDDNAKIRFLKPFGFSDYIKLQMEAFCVLSDSGTVTEEASLLGFPAITIREAHERPEGMDEGTLVMSLQSEEVVNAVRVITQQHQSDDYVPPRIVTDYDAGAVSQKVLRIVLSYINYVNWKVWSKNESA